MSVIRKILHVENKFMSQYEILYCVNPTRLNVLHGDSLRVLDRPLPIINVILMALPSHFTEMNFKLYRIFQKCTYRQTSVLIC